jgi:hypothetical protein
MASSRLVPWCFGDERARNFELSSHLLCQLSVTFSCQLSKAGQVEAAMLSAAADGVGVTSYYCWCCGYCSRSRPV